MNLILIIGKYLNNNIYYNDNYFKIGRTLIYEVSFSGFTELVSLLIDMKADPNIQDNVSGGLGLLYYLFLF